VGAHQQHHVADSAMETDRRVMVHERPSVEIVRVGMLRLAAFGGDGSPRPMFGELVGG